MVAHVKHNSGEIEWYTPSRIIESARKVMGRIDLDPASSDIAQRIVKADAYYTIENNGLSKEWKGRVWMNPPYKSDLISKFVGKLINHYRIKEVVEAIVITNNSTETGWFQAMLNACSAICFHQNRVGFVSGGKAKLGALQGQAIFYFGQKPADFFWEFRKYGFILFPPD